MLDCCRIGQHIAAEVKYYSGQNIAPAVKYCRAGQAVQNIAAELKYCATSQNIPASVN